MILEAEIDGLVLRKANKEDAALLAEALWQSEGNGFEAYSYAKLFGLNHREYIAVFSNILENDLAGHQLSWKAFRIAEVNGKPAAILSVYHEGESGTSVHIMTGLLMEHFAREKVISAFKILKENEEVALPRTKNTIQLESCYTFPDFRRKGMLKKLHNWVYDLEVAPMKLDVEVVVWTDNHPSKSFFESLGYEQAIVKTYSNSDKGRISYTKRWKE